MTNSTPAGGSKPTTATLLIRSAGLSDLPEICAIEQASLPTPWSPRALREDIAREGTVYLLAELNGATVGYGGMWVYADEAHVGTLAVCAESRKDGVGTALMLSLLRRAAAYGAKMVVLEYRVSNTAAAGLYKKLGFGVNRIRKGYYQESGEDAVEAILFGLLGPEVRERLDAIKTDWERRHGGSFTETE